MPSFSAIPASVRSLLERLAFFLVVDVLLVLAPCAVYSQLVAGFDRAPLLAGARFNGMLFHLGALGCTLSMCHNVLELALPVRVAGNLSRSHYRFALYFYLSAIAHSGFHLFNAFYHPLHLYSGIALLVALLAHAAVSWRLALRAPRHAFFLLAHRALLILYVLSAAFHQNHWYYELVTGALYLTDYSLGRFLMTRRFRIAGVEVYPSPYGDRSGDVFELTLARDSEFPFKPGQYARVWMRGCSRWQWHCFTLVGDCSDTTQVRLLIRACGSWTRDLLRRSQLKIGSRLSLKGPYTQFGALETSRLLCESTENALALFVSTGTAITSHLAILDTVIADVYGRRKNVLKSFSQRIIVVWVIRSVFDMNFALSSFARYERKLTYRDLYGMLQFHIYVTRPPSHDQMRLLPLVRQSFYRAKSYLVRDDAARYDLYNAEHLDDKERTYVRFLCKDPDPITGLRMCSTFMHGRPDVARFAKEQVEPYAGRPIVMGVTSNNERFIDDWSSMGRRYGAQLFVERAL